MLDFSTFVLMTNQELTKQKRYDKAYLRLALEWAKLSYCQRKKVGALIVKNGWIQRNAFWF